MKILVLGVGGIGGFFGSHLHNAGEDITFLVRKQRKTIILNKGIKIKSGFGNISINPKLITKEELNPIYDIILLACKSYNLDEAINDLKPLKNQGIIIPLLNGQTHLQKISRFFNEKNVYGGVAYISSNVDKHNVIHQIGKNKKIIFGSCSGKNSDLIKDFLQSCKKTKFDSELSDNISQEIWEKWIFIATVAGATTLFRTSLEKINKTKEGKEFIINLFKECCNISKLNGFQIRENVKKSHKDFFINPNSKVKASMLIDMEKRYLTEHKHIFLDFIKLGVKKGFEANILKTIYLNMLVYEDSRLI